MFAYFRQFAVLKETNRAFWGVQIINLLDSLYSFAFVAVSTIFLTRNLGFGDVAAGAALSWLGIMTSIFFFASGPIVDRYGLKKSLYLSLALVTVVRVGMVACGYWPLLPGRGWLFLLLMGLGGLPSAIKGTAYQIGVKRFTTKRSQSAGFNLWYIIMNIGALLAGFLVQYVDVKFNQNFLWIIVTGLITAFLSFLSAWLMVRSEAQLGGDKPVEPSASADAVARPRDLPGWLAARAVQLKRYWRTVICHPAFLRMMAAMTLTLGVRMVFLYWGLLSPKYWKRVIGPDAALGLLESINPAIIIVGLFLLVPVINRFRTYSMLTYGCFVAALSLLPMTIPWSWISADVATAYYATSIVSMVAFSFGELMFSPRLSQYILAIAPQGQEGIYSSFAALPYFFAKTAVGFLSGVMLVRWCPETRVVDGVARPLREILATDVLPYWETPEALWCILAIAAIVGPLIMLPLKSWFTRGMKDDPTAEPQGH